MVSLFGKNIILNNLSHKSHFQSGTEFVLKYYTYSTQDIQFTTFFYVFFCFILMLLLLLLLFKTNVLFPSKQWRKQQTTTFTYKKNIKHTTRHKTINHHTIMKCIYEYVPITLSLLPLFPFNPFCIMFHGRVLLVVIASAIHLDFKYIFIYVYIYVCTKRHTTNNLQWW